ncbi:hypothetical protein COEX109129_33965 [Corallococcus exiguus]
MLLDTGECLLRDRLRSGLRGVGSGTFLNARACLRLIRQAAGLCGRTNGSLLGGWGLGGCR